MPFRSLSQEHFMFAKHPQVAQKFANATSPQMQAHLPKKVGPGPSASPWLHMQPGAAGGAPQMPQMYGGGEYGMANGGVVAPMGAPNMQPEVGPPMGPNPMPPMVHPMGPNPMPQVAPMLHHKMKGK